MAARMPNDRGRAQYAAPVVIGIPDLNWGSVVIEPMTRSGIAVPEEGRIAYGRLRITINKVQVCSRRLACRNEDGCNLAEPGCGARSVAEPQIADHFLPQHVSVDCRDRGGG